MKTVAALAFLLGSSVAPAASVDVDYGTGNPVQKVVVLLKEMLEKGKAAKNAEEVEFASYKRFCEDTASSKNKAIQKGTERAEVLKADIQKAATDADRLGKEIAAHDEDIATWTGDTEAATKVRQMEQADYEALHEDYSESIDALGRAIEVLKTQPTKIAQASLLQVSSLRSIPAEAKRVITAFLEEGAKGPQGYGYEGHLKGILEMLAELQDKFVAERTTIEKEETASKQEYELMVQDLRNQIESATQIREEKASTKAKKLQAKANAEGDLTDTSTTLEADKAYVTDLVATCEQKATDFSTSQELRADEIKAVTQAIEIVGDIQDKGESLIQLRQVRGTALAHLRSDAQGATRTILGAFLQNKAEELNSRMLSSLASRVNADPFQKVKKMIQDLLVKLQQEANEEAEHKGWCDTELKTNERTRDQKTQAVETLHAEIDMLQSSIAKLTKDIAALNAAVAELDAAVAKATELRAAESEKNKATIADAQKGAAAVAKALAVLQEFFAKAGDATGSSAMGGGIVSMLEVIQSDFAKLESETRASEEASQREYDTLINDTKVDRAAKTSDIENKTAKKQDQAQALTERQADLEGTQRELTAAIAYFDKLKPSCVDSGVSYEDRVARREAELESLQQALRILNGE